MCRYRRKDMNIKIRNIKDSMHGKQYFTDIDNNVKDKKTAFS